MSEKSTKFIFISGSIMSGLGKGILTASIGKLLQSRGYSVMPIKFDGYLNVDCGTMNPFRHGEVFVLDDGSEVDLDFGTYERFLNISLNRNSSITGGKLFQRLLERERKGEYLGRDVQFIPHLTNEIKSRIKKVRDESKADVVLVEIGGTIGDIENGYFLEAVRQLCSEYENSVFIQLTYVPSLSPGEQKTKPTQQANKLIRSMGLKPDLIVCREQEPLKKEPKSKISLFCGVPIEAIFDDPMLNTVYELPLVLDKQGLYDVISKKLKLSKKDSTLRNWGALVSKIKNPSKGPIRIAIVGKYTDVKDAYISVKEALLHSAAKHSVSIILDWVESTKLEEDNSPRSVLGKYNGIIVPGGFGKRGTEGKITAIKFARENRIPYLGLCLGLQLMVVEYARNVCGLNDANSKEFNANTPSPVIALLPEQQRIVELGGTMRLGAYGAKLKKGSIAYRYYKSESIFERHRHRYEVNPDYVSILEENGLVVSGTYPKNNIVEIVEWPDRFGFGVATQSHVELKSRLENPAPLFLAFIDAILKNMYK